MDKLYELSETGCCPRFDPGPWDEKELVWKDKLFLEDHVRSFLHIPLGFDKMIAKNMDKIKGAGALLPEPLTLTDEKSLWGADVYIGISKEVPGVKLKKISGTFLSKVFEGPYKDAGKWVKEMMSYVRSKGRDVKGLYFYYTTCPKCAEFYGKNYTVLLAKIQ